jgi:hypothetical protein
MFGTMGKCGICGARFRYGDIWTHIPTGDIVHVGHDCAEKYAMLADRDDFNAALEQLKRKRAAFIEETRRNDAKQYFLSCHPTLEEDLKVEHRIILDIKSRFDRYGSLSPAQVALVAKLATEARSKVNAPQETYVECPTGRQVIRGIMVSSKPHESDFGIVIKITIKIVTPDGIWLAWGTKPTSLFASSKEDEARVGDEIELTGTLKQGRDKHFAIFSRPAKARIVKRRESEAHHSVNP